jgi:hypothetical protein
MPLLLILLLLATPVAAQAPPTDRPDSPPVAAPMLHAVDDRWTPAPADATLRIEQRAAAHGNAADSAAQPTVQGFLYHVFLTAVTALVTALIWRAVF